MARVDGLARLQARIAAIPADTRAALQVELQRSAQDVVTLAKTLAPVDQGTLVDSIKSEPGRHDLAVLIVAGGPSAPHAIHIEQGTEKMAAQPFFYPAWRAMRRTVRRRLGRAIAKAARRDASS